MRWLALAFLVGCGSGSATPLVIGEPPTEWSEPNVSIHGSYAITADVERSAIDFVNQNVVGEFVVVGSVVDETLTSIAFEQRHHGLPVITGHLGAVVSHGRLVLVQGTVYPVRDIETTPRIGLDQAIATVHDAIVVPHSGDRDSGRLVVFRNHLAWEVSAWRGLRQLIVYVDAQSGAIVTGYDDNRYEYAGVATNHVDERTVGDKVVSVPAGHLRLRTARGATTLTRGDGAFEFRGTQSGPLLVSANLQGAYVDVQNLEGANAAFVGVMRPETNYALEWTENRSTPEERDVFRGTSTTNRFVATVFPNLEWIAEPVLARVNHPYTCNAFWNGSSINFFVAGGGCNNTGRIFDVVAHEWGHGLDQNTPGGAIDGGLGEFIGDLISFVQTNSPLLAPNFLVDGGPVRDLDDPDYQCFDPDVHQVHAAGHLLGAVMFDVFTDLQRAGMTGEPLKRLMLRPIAIAQTRFEWYSAMLAVDDDNGDLADGTPHECLIYNQFKAHSCAGERWPGIPADDPPHCR